MAHFEWSALVTTARRPDRAMDLQARSLAERVGGLFVERGEQSLAHLQLEGAPVVVVEMERVVCHHDGQVFFFHPGLIRMRVQGDGKGTIDPLIHALDLQTGDTVVDATLGRAGDAIMIAHAVGESGKVIGLEANPVVAELVRLGLGSYPWPDPEILAAMRRITVLCADHAEYLRSCETASVDSVYFDPMFDRALRNCASIEPLRVLAWHEPLTRETLAEARRVARKRVVVKSRKGATTLEDLGIEEVSGGKWSRVMYGVVRA